MRARSGVYHPVDFETALMKKNRPERGHYLLIIPTLDLIIVHRVDNEPPAKDPKAVAAMTDHEFVTNSQFGHLVKLILDAQTGR